MVVSVTLGFMLYALVRRKIWFIINSLSELVITINLYNIYIYIYIYIYYMVYIIYILYIRFIYLIKE